MEDNTVNEDTSLDGNTKRRLIVIEGLDGSGKATQAKLLCDKLENEGVNVRKVSFPNYESDSSALVKMYLSGEFGSSPEDVNAYAASSFYAVDRYASFKREWKEFYMQGGTIIADRYTTSNAIHQCSKLPRDQWDEYLEWLFKFEYEQMGIPRPDVVIYLKVDTNISQKLLGNRYGGDESKKDIHENNIEYLEKSHEAAEYCRNKFGWNTVECCENNNIKAIDLIGKEIMKIIKSK
jgi:dTMP kinase